MMKEAKFYTEGQDKEVYCTLCPHYCKIFTGGLGKCRVRKNIDGTLFSLNYGKITSYGFDPIEKKPLYHFYPGESIFSIGTYGCNLDCDFCQNWEMVHDDSLSLKVSNEDIISLSKAQESIGIAYTYNEPTIFYEFVYDIAKLARAENMKNVLVTNGFINQEPLIQLLPLIDAMNIDLKSIDDRFYRSICKGKIEPVIETIKTSNKYTHIEVTTLVIDGENSSMIEIEELAKTLSSIDKSIPLHLSRYFPNYKMNLPPTNIETLIEARQIAKRYLDYVYLGNIWGVDNNTYCPNCKSLIVDRHNNSMVSNLGNNHCFKCNQIINIEH